MAVAEEQSSVHCFVPVTTIFLGSHVHDLLRYEARVHSITTPPYSEDNSGSSASSDIWPYGGNMYTKS